MNNNNREIPNVHFNHLYIVLDDKTYRAIQASDFLRSAFPGKELRSTLTAAGERWSGTYFYCQDNYLEFFGESTGRHWRAGAQAGWAGLAFSTDTPHGVDSVRQKISELYGYPPFYELRQLDTAGKKTNWFHYVSLAEQIGLPSFDSWVMEYHPDIFDLKGINLPPSGELTRQAYLSRWNQPGHPEQPGEKLRGSPVFSRVIGATITMDHNHARKYGALLQALGYALKEETGQLVLTANQFSLTIRMHPEAAAAPGNRLSGLTLEMVRPSIAPIAFVFAPGSRLVLNENLTADWYFED